MKISSAHIPELYIQSIDLNDVSQTYVDWLNDPLINQYLETRFSHQNTDTVKSFINSMIHNPHEHLFTIRQAVDDRHVGNIKVGAINTIHKIGEVSLFLGDKSIWGKGFATKAIMLISAYAITYLKLRKLTAGAYKPNIASTKAFLKAGYTPDGILLKHYLLKGQPCDLVKVSLFNDNMAKIPEISLVNS